MAARDGAVSDGAVSDGAVAGSAAGAVTRSHDPTLGLPRSFYLDEAGHLHRDLRPRELAEVLQRGQGALWVDIDATNRHQHALLENVFHFHPLAVEDTLNPNSRVKVEEYPGMLFAIVRGVRFCDDTDDPYDVETYNLCFFLARNVLVTTHGEHAASIDEVVARLGRSPDVLARGVERLMHAIMDGAVDAYFPILDQVDEFAAELDERVLVDFDEKALQDIFATKRLVLSLRRHLSPQRDVFNILSNRPTSLLQPEVQVYFRDIYDHVLRINDSLESYRELLSSAMDSYLSQVSNRLGQVTKGLSIAATLSIPFVMVSGMWGMNFAHIPLSHHPYGFWIMLVLQLALAFGMVWLLRRRKIL